MPESKMDGVWVILEDVKWFNEGTTSETTRFLGVFLSYTAAKNAVDVRARHAFGVDKVQYTPIGIGVTAELVNNTKSRRIVRITFERFGDCP